MRVTIAVVAAYFVLNANVPWPPFACGVLLAAPVNCGHQPHRDSGGVAEDVVEALVRNRKSVRCAPNAEQPRIGLVLSGGGTRGAYEVGVWQELQALGIAPRVKAISGASVGAIAAALFVVGPGAAETVWLNCLDEIFASNTNRIEASCAKTDSMISRSVVIDKSTGNIDVCFDGVATSVIDRVAQDLGEFFNSHLPREGHCDSSRLEKVLDANLSALWPTNSPEVYATALEKGFSGRTLTWHLNGEPHERRIKILRASAAIPFVFDTVEIDGKMYVDGAVEVGVGRLSLMGGDGTPLMPILDNHKDINMVIIVYLKKEQALNAVRRAKNREAAIASGVRLVEIIPSEDINGAFGFGGVFDTSPETARKLIALGRKNAQNALRKGGCKT